MGDPPIHGPAQKKLRNDVGNPIWNPINNPINHPIWNPITNAKNNPINNAKRKAAREAKRQHDHDTFIADRRAHDPAWNPNIMTVAEARAKARALFQDVTRFDQSPDLRLHGKSIEQLLESTDIGYDFAPSASSCATWTCVFGAVSHSVPAAISPGQIASPLALVSVKSSRANRIVHAC